MELTQIARVVVAHNPVCEEEDDPSTADVLAQVELVAQGLAALGLPVQKIAVREDRAWESLAPVPDTAVFNLVEAPPGRPQLHSLNASVLELLGMPFTGSSASTLWLTTDKLATRALLASEGLPVAAGGRLDPERPELLDRVAPPWILKPAFEDASIGLEGNPVCTTREAALERAAALARRFPDQPVLLEHYLAGRELNVSLLAGGGGVEVLPVAEILFEGFPEGKPRVVGYEAKWLEESFECRHTVRHFPAESSDAELLAEARRLSRQAWRLCGLSGYARVDLRLDEAGRPHVLEVNANPCISADSGFMAAAARAGLSPRDVIGRILEDALQSQEKRRSASPVPERGSVCPAQATGSAAGAPTKEPSRDKPNHAPASRPAIGVRRGLIPADRTPLAELIRATGFFNPEEVGVAFELVDEALAQGEASHYRFVVGERDGQIAGYACWGPIPGTRASADLYWIVVHPKEQGRGAGRALLSAVEEWMKSAGRGRAYVETSTRAQYAPTRGFYLACGYRLAAELPDFYAPGDGKAVFVKVL